MPGLASDRCVRRITRLRFRFHGPELIDPSAKNGSASTVSRARPEAAPVPSSTEGVSVPAPSAGAPVTAVMTVQPKRASVGETVLLCVYIRIASAHYIHAKSEAGGPSIPVAVNATFPAGVEPIGDWQFPTPEKERGTSLVYRNSVVLRRSLKVGSSSRRSVGVRNGKSRRCYWEAPDCTWRSRGN
jgi:hypothetical protein